jgi:peptidyl-tRNA hydrolase, PTH2 family
MYKQVIVVRGDLKLPKGKMAAQAAHASVEAIFRALKDTDKAEIARKWRGQGMAKIVVKVDSQEELFKYLQAAKDSNIVTALITDAGRTTIAPGTVTCFALGPDDESKIDSVTGELKLV